MFNDVSALIVLPLCGAYALLYAGLHPIDPLWKVGTKADISYGLYLYAWPVQILLLWYFRSISPWLMFIVTVPIAMGLAYLSWYLVEKPALALKPRV